MNYEIFKNYMIALHLPLHLPLMCRVYMYNVQMWKWNECVQLLCNVVVCEHCKYYVWVWNLKEIGMNVTIGLWRCCDFYLHYWSILHFYFADQMPVLLHLDVVIILSMPVKTVEYSKMYLLCCEWWLPIVFLASIWNTVFGYA